MSHFYPSLNNILYVITIISTLSFCFASDPILERENQKSHKILSLNNPQELKKEALALYQKKQYQEASQEYEKFIKTHDATSEDRRIAATIYTAAGKYKETLEQYKAIVGRQEARSSDYQNIVSTFLTYKPSFSIKNLGNEYESYLNLINDACTKLDQEDDDVKYASKILATKKKEKVEQTSNKKSPLLKDAKASTAKRGDFDWNFEDALTILQSGKINTEKGLDVVTQDDYEISYHAALSNELQKVGPYSTETELKNKESTFYHIGQLHYYYALTVQDQEEQKGYMEEAKTYFTQCTNFAEAASFLEKIEEKFPAGK